MKKEIEKKKLDTKSFEKKAFEKAWSNDSEASSARMRDEHHHRHRHHSGGEPGQTWGGFLRWLGSSAVLLAVIFAVLHAPWRQLRYSLGSSGACLTIGTLGLLGGGVGLALLLARSAAQRSAGAPAPVSTPPSTAVVVEIVIAVERQLRLQLTERLRAATTALELVDAALGLDGIAEGASDRSTLVVFEPDRDEDVETFARARLAQFQDRDRTRVGDGYRGAPEPLSSEQGSHAVVAIAIVVHGGREVLVTRGRDRIRERAHEVIPGASERVGLVGFCWTPETPERAFDEASLREAFSELYPPSRPVA